MIILRARYAGASGLQAETGALGVVGDNIANTNTTGFKQSRAMFEDVLGAAVGTGSDGAGVRLSRSQQIFAQGAAINTGQSTDVALSGDGFLVVQGTVDGRTDNFFTRAGALTLNSAGTLVNPDGLAVQGYTSDGKGGYSSSLSPITLPNAPIAPKASTALKITANLDAAAPQAGAAWDPTSPSTTSNLSTSVTVFDSLGNAHVSDVYFRKTGPGTWDFHVLAKGDEITGGTPGTHTEIASGSLNFDSQGALGTQVINTGGTVDFAGASPAQTLTFDFGKPTSAGGTGLDGLTQYGSPSSIAAQSQDGYASGSLAGLKIDSAGVVSGVYTNGQTVATGQLTIAKFRANESLARAGHNLWVATPESGEAATAAAGSGGRAAIVSGSLEQSNVDITQQFVELIAHQRAFQANSKTITTADQMLQELMTIKQ